MRVHRILVQLYTTSKQSGTEWQALLPEREADSKLSPAAMDGMLARFVAAVNRSLFSESPARVPPWEVMYSFNQGPSKCKMSMGSTMDGGGGWLMFTM